MSTAQNNQENLKMRQSRCRENNFVCMCVWFRIHPNLRSVIYCQAVAAGGKKEWEFAWNKFQSSEDTSEKDQLREALSCTKKIWLLNRWSHKQIWDRPNIKHPVLVCHIQNYLSVEWRASHCLCYLADTCSTLWTLRRYVWWMLLPLLTT